VIGPLRLPRLTGIGDTGLPCVAAGFVTFGRLAMAAFPLGAFRCLCDVLCRLWHFDDFEDG
jgi:hypothetical protein